MNGHLAGVGDQPGSRMFEHGVQVIDEDKQFKCVGFSNFGPHFKF